MSGEIKQLRKEKEKMHRFGLRIPERLFQKIVNDKWTRRKSINQLIEELLEEQYKYTEEEDGAKGIRCR